MTPTAHHHHHHPSPSPGKGGGSALQAVKHTLSQLVGWLRHKAAPTVHSAFEHVRSVAASRWGAWIIIALAAAVIVLLIRLSGGRRSPGGSRRYRTYQ
jgi:hypothetical protein